MQSAQTSDDEAPEARGRTDLLVTASFFGTVVEETFVARGGAVQIGNSDALAVPVPEGWPYMARVAWRGPHRVVVTDHEGREHPLEPGDSLEIAAAPVELTLRLVRRYPLRRTEDVQVWGSLAWFTVVLAATLLTMQAGIVWENRCYWFGIGCPDELTASYAGGAYSAEYLARLLREDYAGDDKGAIEPEEREVDERRVTDVYMPAGAEGPVTEMGGAEQVAREEIRTPKQDEEQAAPEAKTTPELISDDNGTPVQAPELINESDEDGIADGDVDGEQLAEAPAEDKRGWGIQDWYDAQDEAFEDREIEVMLRAARDRLRIDPDDPAALSILSYYQYLAEDFEGAERTYDRYIGLYPDEAAGYNNKALIYKRTGDYLREEALYRVALALNPGDFTALNNLAVCLAHQGRFAEAEAIMKRLEDVSPDDPYAHLHRAKVFAAQGEDARAYQYIEKALQGMAELDTLHHIEFRQDIRVDPAFERLRQTKRFHAILIRYYGDASPLQE